MWPPIYIETRLSCCDSYGLSKRIQPQTQPSQVPARTRPPEAPQRGFPSPQPSSKDDRLPSKDLSESEHDTVDKGQDEVDPDHGGDPCDRAVRRRGEEGEGEGRGLVRRARERGGGRDGSNLDLVVVVLVLGI
jgi:hypothetical protein